MKRKRDQEHDLDPRKVAFGKGDPFISAKSRVKYDINTLQLSHALPTPKVSGS